MPPVMLPALHDLTARAHTHTHTYTQYETQGQRFHWKDMMYSELGNKSTLTSTAEDLVQLSEGSGGAGPDCTI